MSIPPAAREPDWSAWFGPDGALARALPDYEPRPQQARMASAVWGALTGALPCPLLVEAGTGVGKTFAYLIPLLLWTRETGRAAVVSTHTINLQDQLIGKDIPELRRALPWEFSVAVGKGRGNYLGLRRMHQAWSNRPFLFDQSGDVEELARVLQWSEVTAGGSTSDLDRVPPPAVWSQVASEHGNCLGQACDHFNACFYQKARQRLAKAELLIVNHHFFFSDLMLRKDGAPMLPDYGAVVFDEAHHLPAVAQEHFGTELTRGQVTSLLNALAPERRARGFLAALRSRKALGLAREVRQAADEFFHSVETWLAGGRAPANGRIREAEFVPDTLSGPLHALEGAMGSLQERVRTKEDRVELGGYMNRAARLAQAVDEFVHHPRSDAVYWAERRGHRGDLVLKAAPLDVGPRLRELLFSGPAAVIGTSATLRTADAPAAEEAPVPDEGFGYLRRELGIEGGHTLALGSPFRFSEQVRVRVDTTLPPPRSPRYAEALAQSVVRAVTRSEGRALVLFTSLETMATVARLVRDPLREADLTLLVQGEGLTRHHLLETFKASPRCVLFGADSFWQGVDVPGEALSHVVITKLPFPVPGTPKVEAREERLAGEGRNAFADFFLPEAILRFRQGFGRLIRRRTDRGEVAVLDPRIVTQPYGRWFRAAVPECSWSYEGFSDDEGADPRFEGAVGAGPA